MPDLAGSIGQMVLWIAAIYAGAHRSKGWLVLLTAAILALWFIPLRAVFKGWMALPVLLPIGIAWFAYWNEGRGPRRVKGQEFE